MLQQRNGVGAAVANEENSGLTHCPHCTDAVVDLDEHLKTCREYKADPLADARRTIEEHEQQQTEACLAELNLVLAKYGRRLEITQPQINIVPL